MSLKKFFRVLLVCLCLMDAVSAQHLQVSGSVLQMDGKPVVLRGINYPIIDDGSIDLSKAADYRAAIDQAALTGANCLRLAWYEPYTHWRDASKPGTVSGYVSDGHLSGIIGYCISKQMIPILELHNITCSSNWKKFRSAITDFWCDPDILNVIQTHKARLIINLANEFGKVNWTEGPADAADTFRVNYVQAIDTLRKLGVQVPIMIDAPDCGQSSSVLVSLASALNAADPLHNLIFSAHTYWSSYAGTKATADSKLAEMSASGFCWTLGEISNKQDDAGCADLDLSALYPQILQTACTYNIGWLAWVYNQDCSALREMSSDGSFSKLTTFGNDIVNNPVYGLKSSASCRAVPLSFEELRQPEKSALRVYPNPLNSADLQVESAEAQSFSLWDINGRMISTGQLRKGLQTLFLEDLKPGIYLLRAGNERLLFSKL